MTKQTWDLFVDLNCTKSRTNLQIDRFFVETND
jgi:hypothetical protein